MFFGKKVEEEDKIDWGLVWKLCEELAQDEPFDTTPYLGLPNATKTYIKRLHKAQ